MPLKPEIVTIGAGRGSTAMQPHVAQLVRQQVIVDPAPNKALVLANKGKTLGIATVPIQAAGERYLEATNDDTPVVVAVDNAQAVKTILEVDVQRPLFIYFLLVLPSQGMAGFMGVFMPEDTELKRRFASFFGKLSGVLLPNSSRHVFGQDAPSSNRFSEGLYRKAFAKHFNENMTAMSESGVPYSSPAQITFDGRNVSQVLLLDESPNWRTFEQLRQELRSQMVIPIEPGSEFAICETVGDDIRIHKARYRVTDRQFVLEGMMSLDKESLNAWNEMMRLRELRVDNAARMTD